VASRDVLIIVPTLGERRDLLRISVASLIAQTAPVRVLVVTGSEPERLRGLWPEAAPVSVIAQEGRGLSAAINQGWAHDGWRSELTSWLGDDDALPPWSVEAAVQALDRRPAAVAVHGPCLVVDESGTPVRVYRNGRWASALAGYGVNLLPQPGALFRTSAVERLGGLDPDLALAMDVDLFARLRTLGRLTNSPRQLGVFREHTSGLSTAQAAAAREEARRSAKGQHTRPWQRVADSAALPLTRVVAAVNRLRPPPPSRYWSPTGP
jgi:GT2 family glycosyltransferase